jgi:AbrB family looped-hinge helix DNA binding protein
MATSAIMSSKGQLVIPTKLRDELGLKAGTRVVLRKQGKGLFLEPSNLEAVMALCGKYAQYPLEENLAADRKQWDERLEEM